MMQINITHIDTACVLLDINGFKILTDPTLDSAGGLYHHGFGSLSRKTGEPALENVDLQYVDLVLLSHHQHKDNFDIRGKTFAETVPQIISTPAAARVLKNTTGLASWETCAVETDKLSNLKITATPAQHHPWWVPAFFAGPVTGFIIEFDGQENGALYISGDTVYFKGIDEIARRFKIDIGIFHVGSAQFRYLTGFGQYTMDSADLIKAVEVLQPNTIIPVHFKGWTHFKETEKVLRQAIGAQESIEAKTIYLEPGKRTKVG